MGIPAAVLEPNNKWHPLAQNLIRMWYVGQWKALGDWAATQFGEAGADGRKQVPKGYNEFGRDIARIISPAGYQEGLAWRAMGSTRCSG